MIRIERLSYSVGTFALQDISLEIAPGEYFVLLGPTGSGKTLLVECICGLNRIAGGRIFVGGRDVTFLEPRLRNLGYLPQDYALFPHKTVEQNIAFGLFRRRPLLAVPPWQYVSGLMHRLGVAHLAQRLPRNLSGGEKQRVALARALAVLPQALLLDEPVSALDEATRDQLCRLLKQLQRDTQTTTIHVCHNFAEMLAVADRVGVIHQGRIWQVGTPQELLERPCCTLVAQFMQAGNLFAAAAEATGQWLRLKLAGGLELLAPRPDGQAVPAQVAVMVRPENIRLQGTRPPSTPPGTTVLQGVLREVIELGPTVKAHVACQPPAELIVLLGKWEYRDLALCPGDAVYLSLAAENVHVMPP